MRKKRNREGPNWAAMSLSLITVFIFGLVIMMPTAYSATVDTNGSQPLWTQDVKPAHIAGAKSSLGGTITNADNCSYCHPCAKAASDDAKNLGSSQVAATANDNRPNYAYLQDQRFVPYRVVANSAQQFPIIDNHVYDIHGNGQGTTANKCVAIRSGPMTPGYYGNTTGYPLKMPVMTLATLGTTHDPGPVWPLNSD
jgi:hypothetical protein